LKTGFAKTCAMVKAFYMLFLHVYNMFLQDAHMRPLWTGVHQEMEFDSTCGDSARQEDVVPMLRYWVC